MGEVSLQVPPRSAQEMKLMRDRLPLVGSADAQSSGRGRGAAGKGIERQVGPGSLSAGTVRVCSLEWATLGLK